MEIVKQTCFLKHHLQYRRHGVLALVFLKHLAIMDVVCIVNFHLIH